MKEAENANELLTYFQTVLHHKLLVAQTFVMTVLAVFLFSTLQTPLYAASAALVASPPDYSGIFTNAPLRGISRDPMRRIATQIEMFSSLEVANTAAKLLQEDQKTVQDLLHNTKVSQVGQTDVLKIQAIDPDPERAAVLANAMADAFATFQANRSVQTITQLTAEISSKLEEARNHLSELDGSLAAALAARNAQEAERLMAERDAIVRKTHDLDGQVDSLQIQASLQQQQLSIIERAAAPDSPSSPRTKRNLFLGGIAGVIIGVGLALLKDFLDDSIRDLTSLEELGGIPAVGVIPNIFPDQKKKHASTAPAIAQMQTPAAEAFRRLRTNLQFLGLDQPIRALGITSARANEGKSTVIVNLAASLAHAGLRVIIVGADLRKPSLHKVFHTQNKQGLSTLLTGKIRVEDVLIPVTVDGTRTQLWFLPSGPIPPNPAELLGSKRMGEIITDLTNRCDLLLCDMTPTLPVSDACVLAPKLDGVLLLAKAGVTKHNEVTTTRDSLTKVGTRLLGVILNQVDAHSTNNKYSYYYDYAYKTEEEDKDSTTTPTTDFSSPFQTSSSPLFPLPQGQTNPAKHSKTTTPSLSKDPSSSIHLP